MARRDHLTMQALPPHDRPYEKLEEQGAAALSEAELLAILLGSGTSSQSALELAQGLVVRHPQLSELADLSLEEWQRTPGIGRSKALRLAASFEIARRLPYAQSREQHPKVNSSETAIRLLEPLLVSAKKEEFHVLLLDIRGRLIKRCQISTGGICNAAFQPRDLFREAIRADASGIILCHNHPSGEASPSPADIAATRRLQKMGEELGIRVLDHIIVARKRSLSLKSLGVF